MDTSIGPQFTNHHHKEKPTRYLSNFKITLIFYIISLLLILSFSSLTISSSLSIYSDYSFLPAIQLIAIVQSIIFAVTYLASAVLLKISHSALTKYGIRIIFFGGVCSFVTIVMCFLSLRQSTESTKCEYFITHSGHIDGQELVSYMQVNPAVPSCQEMEEIQDQLSIANQLRAASITILNEVCGRRFSQGEKRDHCLSIDSISIIEWNDTPFLLQLIALGIGIVGLISVSSAYVILIDKLEQYVKKTKALIHHSKENNHSYQQRENSFRNEQGINSSYGDEDIASEMI